MEIELLEDAKTDFEFWKNSGNIAIQKKIQQLFQSIQETPFEGIGKPEALNHKLFGKWSRWINNQHRIFYGVEGEY